MARTTLTTEQIRDNSIINADISPSAAIDGSKISPNFAAQNVVTSGFIQSTSSGIKFPDNTVQTTASTGGGPGGSSGSVQYKSGTSFAGDSYITWDSVNYKLAIGGTPITTTIPGVEIKTSGNITAAVALTNFGATSNAATVLAALSAGGTSGSPAATPSGTHMLEISGFGYANGAFDLNTYGASISYRASELWTSSAHGTNIWIQACPAGSINASTVGFITGDNGGCIGINNQSPVSAIDIISTSTSNPAGRVTLYAATAAGPGIQARKARGTPSSPQPVQTNDAVGNQAYDGGGFFAVGSAGHFAGENWVNGTNRGTYYAISTIPNGSTTATERLRVAPGGAVGVGTGGNPVASAQLQVDSTAKGFLPPRMTTAQRTAISTPATGLMVYDTDLNQFMGYNGSAWIILG